MCAFHGKLGALTTMKLGPSVPLICKMVKSYLELSYVYGNENGGCSKTSFSTVMDLCCVLLNNLGKFSGLEVQHNLKKSKL